MSEQLPSGSWPTPVTADLVIQAARSLSGVALDGDTVYWSEMRPPTAAGSRSSVWSRAGRRPTCCPPTPTRARRPTSTAAARGGSATASSGTSTGRTSGCEGSTPVRSRWCSPEPHPRVARSAGRDGDVHPVDGGWRRPGDPPGRWTVCPSTWSTRSSSSTPAGRQETVVSGPDFVSDPRWSPDGSSLAWLEWDHPSMPWDSSTPQGAEPDGGRHRGRRSGRLRRGCVPAPVGTGRVAVVLLRPDGLVVAPPLDARGGVEQVFHGPGRRRRAQWLFGPRRYGFLADGRVVFAVLHEGRDSVCLIEARRHGRRAAGRRHLRAGRSRPRGTEVVLIGSSATTAGRRSRRFDVRRPDVVEDLSPRRDLGIGPEWFSEPEHIEFPGGDGRPTYANFYRPTSPAARPLDGELPPLIVMIHGGPTSNAVTTLSLAMQFWTTRGIAVVDVDYGGSTGYGRAYRDRLQGQWGLLDVGRLRRGRALAGRAGLDRSRAVRSSAAAPPAASRC